MKRVLSYLKPYAARLVAGTSIKFAGTIMDLLLPWILAYVIDSVISTKNVTHILLWGGVMVACSIAALVANVSANRMASRVSRDAVREIRHDLFVCTARLSCRQTDGFTIPSLEARLTTDTYNLHQMLSMMQRLGIRAPILLLGGVAVTLTLEPVLALVLIATMPLIGLVTFQVSRRGIPLFTKLQQAVDGLVRTVREDAMGIRIIKALSKTAYEKDRFSRVNQTVSDAETRVNTVMAVSNPLINLFLYLGLAVVIVVGAYRVDAGLTQPGKILAFLTYFTIMSTAMLSLARMFTLYSRGSASAQRVSQVLEAEQEPLIQPPDHADSAFHILFEHVSFSYNQKKDHLSDISFALKRGETLGIIGPTGCGKSTIINLLIRFYDPDSGVIRIGGDNLNGIPLEHLYTRLGIVFQNDALFAESVGDNIRFGRQLSQEQVEAAARDAQASEFIEGLPDRYEHLLTAKGTNLSGGQKQRLLIARALAAQPEILILDDSSSALDYQTDARLRGAIRTHFQGTTTIIVTQRVSSILYADRILVLEEGRVIGQGRHEELLETCESYQQISRSQMGGGANG